MALAPFASIPFILVASRLPPAFAKQWTNSARSEFIIYLQLIYLQHIFRSICRLSPEMERRFDQPMVDMEAAASAPIDDELFFDATEQIMTGTSIPAQ